MPSYPHMLFNIALEHQRSTSKKSINNELVECETHLLFARFIATW